jgi:sortase A
MRRGIGYLLLFMAGFSLWQGGWIEAKAWLAQGMIDYAWEHTDSLQDRVRPWSWADTWPVARLKLPRLKIERTILAGASGRTLAFGPGWVEQTSPPGDGGRTMIAGHRDTHFRFLQHLVVGDQIILVRSDEREVRYRVRETLVVHESAAGLMGEASAQELLLVTCYPFNAIVPGGELRYVVRAQAESSFPREGETG